MNKVSVMGATGFIGSTFCEMYPEICYPEPRENNSPKYNDILYLISTTTNYNIFTNTQIDIDTNLKKLMYVLENCKNRDVTFTYISSWFCYGYIKSPAKETDLCSPSGFYSISKRAAEEFLICFCKTFNIKYKIIRLGNVFGEGDKFSAQKNALQYLAQKIKRNEDIKLYFGGDFLRDFSYKKSIAEGIKFIMDNGSNNEIYNLGSGRPTRFLDVMEFVKEQTNSISKFEAISPPDFHKTVQSARDFWLDTSKIEKLGWKNKWSIWDGLRETIKSL